MFKLALVTGASSGIGEALAILLAQKGINLILSGRNKTKLYHLADHLREYVNVVVYCADLAKEEERKALLAKMLELKPDLIVNNAGFGLYGSITDLETNYQLDVVAVNVLALCEITIEAAKMMVQNQIKGTIMNVSSVAGMLEFPYFASYASSKAFVNSFSIAADEELVGQGVRVLVACPGKVWTHFARRASFGKMQGEDGSKMTAEFAAKEIWQQIEQGKKIHVFSFKYRFFAFLAHYLLPRFFLLKILKKEMQKRID